MPWPFLIVARAKFCCDHIHRFLNLKTMILWQILVKRYPGCLPGRVAHVSTHFGSGSYLTSSNRQRTHSDLVSVTGIRLKCTHRFKIPLSVGDFALVLTCQKGRFSDIHRHRFVDIWCWPCPGQVVMVLLKNMQLHWCKFATWRSIILWVAPEKYLVIHLGKRKYICQMSNKCVHIESL